MNTKLKMTLSICGAAVFAALFLFSGVMLAIQHADQKQSAEAFDEIAALIQETPESSESDTENTEGEDVSAEETALTSYQKYAAVYEQNHDFVGWITIDDTNINYPVMQTPDNPDFYLKHAFDRSYSNYGTPYVQENCMVGSSDNVVLYGHHMTMRWSFLPCRHSGWVGAATAIPNIQTMCYGTTPMDGPLLLAAIRSLWKWR